MVMELSFKIYKVGDFTNFLLFEKGINASIVYRDYNTINGEKVLSNESRKLINDLYNECF